MATKSTKKKATSEVTAEEVAATAGPPDAGEGFGTVGDVDVADVDPGSGKGEVGPIILPGFWVRLSTDKSVPKKFKGVVAQVVESPWAPAPIGVLDQPIRGYTFEEGKDFLVKTVDSALATLSVPQAGIAEVGQMRVDLHPYS